MENYYQKQDVKKYCQKADNLNNPLHHFDTPFRSLVVAPSGSGKSNFITNLIALFCKNKGTFDNNLLMNHYTAFSTINPKD